MPKSVYRDSSDPAEKLLADLKSRAQKLQAQLDGVRKGAIPESTLRTLSEHRGKLEKTEQCGDMVTVVTVLESYLDELEKTLRTVPFHVNRFVDLPQVVPEPHTLRGGLNVSFERVNTSRTTDCQLLDNLDQVEDLVRELDQDAEVYAIREHGAFRFSTKRRLICARFRFQHTPFALLWNWSWRWARMLSVATSVPRSFPQLHILPNTSLLRLLACRIGGQHLVSSEDLAFRNHFSLMASTQAARLLVTDAIRQNLLWLVQSNQKPSVSVTDCAAELNLRCIDIKPPDLMTIVNTLDTIRRSDRGNALQ